MKTQIINKLTEIEKANNIKILFACESGSRAWGFPSPDSDYDVRFIYVRPINFYLSVAENTDHLSFAINDDLDISGWDVRKALQLIRKSNTTPFEWLQSPIIYKEDVDFKDELWNLCPNYFSKRVNIHHYLGIAKGAYNTIENKDEIKIKKLFYVLRPLLAAKWNLEKNTIAPMNIQPLLTLLPNELANSMQDLIQIKSTAAEGYVINIESTIKTFIENTFKNLEEQSKNLDKESFGIDELDTYFIKTIRHYDY